MIIAVDYSTAQCLHVNSRMPNRSLTNDELSWSVRTTGDFIIIMNNGLSLPIIIRHPQRFNDSRSFVAAFKREFLNLLEMTAVPHAKIRLVRDRQFENVYFTTEISPQTARQLDEYQHQLSDSINGVNWEKRPTNVEIAYQLAEKKKSGAGLTVVDALEQDIMMNYHLAAHPKLNEHNRSYLYRSASLNDIMNAVAVNQHFITDYQTHLSRAGQDDDVIERNTEVAADYFSYCEGLGISPLDDLTFPYYYLLHYRENSDESVTDARLRAVIVALQELARFMYTQRLFSNNDLEQFVQAVKQGQDDLHRQNDHQIQNMFNRLQLHVDKRWQGLAAPRRYTRQCFKVRVELSNYSPQIWREFTVGDDTRLDKFCLQILALFNAEGNHLFELDNGSDIYQLPQMRSGFVKTFDLTEHWLGDYQVGDHFTLVYDFGDTWQFRITLVDHQSRPRRQNDGQAHLLAGFGSGIIEDIGGT